MAEATPKIEVTMQDGRVVLFTEKQKVIKNHEIVDGKVIIILDLKNGQSIRYQLPDSMILEFAAHGAKQKFGDEIASESDPADAYEALVALATRVDSGDWNAVRKGEGSGGVSILIKALVELSGKTVDEIRAYLAPMSQKEKLAIRASSRVKPIVERLEAERDAKKGASVDTDSLLDGLLTPAV